MPLTQFSSLQTFDNQFCVKNSTKVKGTSWKYYFIDLKSAFEHCLKMIRRVNKQRWFEKSFRAQSDRNDSWTALNGCEIYEHEKSSEKRKEFGIYYIIG